MERRASGNQCGRRIETNASRTLHANLQWPEKCNRCCSIDKQGSEIMFYLYLPGRKVCIDPTDPSKLCRMYCLPNIQEIGTSFTDTDVSIIEAFAIFCGLGIHNTQMYENACKLMAKQKVALECLSYHATATQDQTYKLVQDTIPSAEDYCLYSFKFIGTPRQLKTFLYLGQENIICFLKMFFSIDFDLDDEGTCRAAVRMFLQCNLVQQFHIPYDVSWTRIQWITWPDRNIPCLLHLMLFRLGAVPLDIKCKEKLSSSEVP